MSPPRASACDQAAQLLQDENPEATNAFLDHLPLCLACQAFVAQHERQFEAIFERDPIDDHLPAIQDAMERLTRIEFKLPEKPRETWEAPAFPGYELLRTLNETRHSRVFLARQSSLNRQVALKCVRLRETSGDLENLAREAAVLAGLNHPNILTIFETGTWDKGIWLALEYCEGGSLAERLEKPWPARSAARLIRAIAQGTHAAHKQGVIHRDIKPANILFTKDGQPKLGDFGLADGSSQVLMTKPVTNPTGSTPLLKVVGTPSYIAPEQVKGKQCDNRVDVHGLGAVLYHLLTGRPPFLADNAYKALSMAANQMPVSPAELNPLVPEDLNAICMKCLAKDPEKRYDTARDLARDLGSFLEGTPVLARPLGKRERMWKWARRNRALTAALAGVMVLLVASAVGFAGLSLWAMQQKRVAEENAARTQKSQRKSEAQSYFNKIMRAFFEWEYGSAKMALDLLESCPFHLRGWEHDFLTTEVNKNQVVFAGQNDDINGVAVSPDGKWVASTCEDGTVTLWDAENSEQSETILKIDSPTRGVCFSGDGSTLGVAAKDLKVRIWRMKTKTWEANEIDTAPGDPRVFNLFGKSLSLNHDGSSMMVDGKGNSVSLWNTYSGQMEKELVKDQNGGVSGACMSPSGKMAAWGTDALILWNLEEGKELAKVPQEKAQILSLCFFPDGKRVASGHGDNQVRIWDARTGELLQTLQGHTNPVHCVAISPDGKMVASSGDDHIIRLWDGWSGKLLCSFKGHWATVRSLCFTPDGKNLLSGGWDRTIRVWHIRPLNAPMELRTDSQARCVRFNPDNTLLAIGHKNHKITIWHPESQKINHLTGHTHEIRCLDFDPKGEFLATGSSDQTIRIWRYKEGKIEHVLQGHNEVIQSLCYSPDGSKIYSAGDEGLVGIWDTHTGKLEQFLRGHDGPVIGIAVSPNGKWLVTGGTDKTIRIWNSQTGEQVRTLLGHTNRVRSFAFSKDGNRLATGSDDYSILLWDLTTGKNTQVFSGHTSGVCRLEFSPDQSRLMSASFDKTVRIWDLDEGQELFRFTRNEMVRDADFSSDGKKLAIPCDNGSVIVREAGMRLESQSLQPHGTPISKAFYAKTDPFVHGEDISGRKLIWDPSTGSILDADETGRKMSDPKEDSNVSPDGEFLLAPHGKMIRVINRKISQARKTRDHAILTPQKIKSPSQREVLLAAPGLDFVYFLIPEGQTNNRVSLEGKLPPEFHLDQVSGKITGKVQYSGQGTYPFKAKIKNPNGEETIRDFVLKVLATRFSPKEKVGAGISVFEGTGRQFTHGYSLAALHSDGTTTLWGGPFLPKKAIFTEKRFIQLFSNKYAFAALASDGSIHAWGNEEFWGKDTPSGTGFIKIFSTEVSFAALNERGEIVCWGNKDSGGAGGPVGGVFTEVFSNRHAFAALTKEGGIVAWGKPEFGGSGYPTDTGYTQIFSTESAFAALKKDGSITCWGNPLFGGKQGPSGKGFKQIFSNTQAFVALKEDGTLSCWGSPTAGGVGSPEGAGFVSVFATDTAFAALQSDGSIKAWGNGEAGGFGAPKEPGFVQISSNRGAFAALKADGGIMAWGDTTKGGNGFPETKGNISIFSNGYAFSALDIKGHITSWGDPRFGGKGEPLGPGFNHIFFSDQSFAALKSDGRIAVWGEERLTGENAPRGGGFITLQTALAAPPYFPPIQKTTIQCGSGQQISMKVGAIGLGISHRILEGKLPNGLAIHPESGEISGTVKEATPGEYTFVIEANNGIGLPAKKSFSIEVTKE